MTARVLGLALLAALAALPLAGCAGVRAVAPPAAGVWYGIAWETAGETVQFFERLQFTFAENGAWTAVIGSRRAAGTVRLEHGRVVLDGAEVAQPLRVVHYVLAVAPDGRLYGMTLLPTAGKGNRPAQVELRPLR